MLLLASTADLIRVVTGSSGTVEVHASFVDVAAGVITPGRTNTPTITTATTTTVVASPAASTQRNVKLLSGEIQHVAFQSRAGNYVVVQADDGSSQAYMHLREPVTLKKGQAVKAGDQLGVVGQTGRASACHLHFELWTAPGWYLGGKPVDPLPILKEWAEKTADA